MVDGIRFPVLVLGESAGVEMREVLMAVLTCFPDSAIRIEPSRGGEFVGELDWEPELIVVCQTWPDEFSRADVLRMFARFPVARWVCCFGLWCESDGRNRDVWPIGIRVPARAAMGRLLRERDVLLQRAAALPLTAGREEAFEFDSWCPAFRRPVARANNSAVTMGSRTLECRLVVQSPDRELRRCFEDRLRAIGLAVDAGEADADVYLVDADPWNAEAALNLIELRRRRADAAVFALTNFAPPEDVRHAKRCGADEVIPKLIDDAGLAAVLAESLSVDLPVEQIPDADSQLHEERHQKMHGHDERQHD